MSEGDIFVDEYQLINCIATGNFTQVWEVAEKGSPHQLAMKLLLPEAYEEPELVAVLKQEGRVAKVLDHPRLVKLHKAVFDKQHGYLVMDYFRGINLKSQIGSDLPGIQVRIRKLIEGMCSGLTYMHEQGWLHRDIKPDNILFNKSSEVRLIDYSLATRNRGALTKMISGKASKIQGTRTYIAPETIRKKRPSPQTDMYSLGITIFEALAGEPPFKGSSPNDLLRRHLSESPPPPSQFNKNVTPEMDKFVRRLMAKKPADRHKHMNEVFAEFRSLKVFKEDVAELAKKMKAEAEQKQKDGLGQLHHLDSRADADRAVLEKADPEFAAKSTAKRKADAERKAAIAERRRRAAEEQAASEAPPAPMYQPMPQQPMPPVYQQPGYLPPGQQPIPYGYQPVPPGMPVTPQMPQPGPPGMPGMPGMFPPGTVPAQPAVAVGAPLAPPTDASVTMPTSQPEPPQVQPETPRVQPETPRVQPEPPRVQPEPSRVQPERPRSRRAAATSTPPRPQPAPPTAVPQKPTKPKPQLHPSQSEDDGELPLMEDLPDVL